MDFYRENKQDIVYLIWLIVIAVILAFFTKAFIIQPYVVDGQSMQSTLQDHDRLIVNKLPHTFARLSGHPYIPHRGDIIIFNEDNLPGYFGPKQLIKRVIGLPGDHVVVKNGQITVYNTAHPKGFDPDTTVGYKIDIPATQGSFNKTLGSGQIFVCGDNRPNSEDSRYFGPIDSSQIVGKMVLRVYPLNKAQRF